MSGELPRSATSPALLAKPYNHTKTLKCEHEQVVVGVCAMNKKVGNQSDVY